MAAGRDPGSTVVGSCARADRATNAVLAAIADAAALVWRQTRADLGIRLAWVAAVGLLLVISDHLYGGATSFMRAGTGSYVLGVTVLLGASRIPLAVLAPPVAGLSALTVGSELVKAG